MNRIAMLVLAAALLALPAAAQSAESGASGAGKGRPGGKHVAPAESVQASGASAKGQAPAPVKLAEPVQPEEIEFRDGGRVEADPRAKYRTVVRMMINIERAHRDRVARLERLRELYEAAGAPDKLATVARLVELERSRYESALQGYERGLGPVLYPQVRAVIDSRGGTPPAPPVPGAGSHGRATGKSKSKAPVPVPSVPADPNAPKDSKPR